MDELKPILTDEFIAYMRMWSKYYLQRVRATIHTIAQLESEIAELDALMDGLKAVDYSRDKVSSAASDDAMVNTIARRDSLKSELVEELDTCLQAQADAHRALRHVRQPLRSVLTYRYLEGKPWVDVTAALKAQDESYAEVYVRKELHDNGLLELYAFIPHDELPEAI